ncbi:aminoacyl-tRNA hydrolase [Anoxybacter fermentans]|uniref:Peptidyl-tRNA hydrolase n=1 Tax=Anoxybacter fermentans TaxID=1323375 RepID=A0A3Q9HSR5_9FIRM|nr:aminoacyl-tRNA hydrolase [Anoxybacter fermentans]AZR74561.1 aminoacyl-tRNA hydrolase [Anoxybacter fermentans]
MYLIVGLGNPGKEYEETRHNIGFRVIYELAKKHRIEVSGLKYRALIGKGIINDKEVILAQPQTFMNLSGEAVAPLVRYFKIPLENLMVIYDDLDLEPGKLRMRRLGGHGGHNGVRSIIDCLGSKEFPRLRIGIGHPGDLMPVRDYVLSRFFEDELKLMEEAVNLACQGIELWLEQGIERAMNQVNRKTD